ncbi:hybrid sensor histidine kinase/response regulator [Psychromonas ossibalaenae]|uniref:hybrid sensor histidine kinase/response regulator n=1 Tax=Psychromonas ossibalaenae TaxID=444922 RepID=UPI00036772B7|nr:hybrid sensor histidine kinase/response regulator [Psychromonas ossibalaenae]
MNNKQAVQELLFSRWQNLRIYNIVILAAFLFFYSAGTVHSYTFFDSPPSFNLPFLLPFSALLLCAYLLSSIIRKKDRQVIILLPLLTLFTTLFITINSHFETQTTHNSFLYFTLLLPLFYAYLLAYNFPLLLINNLTAFISYTFTAVVGNTSTLVFILNTFFLVTLAFLTIYGHIRGTAKLHGEKQENTPDGSAVNNSGSDYLNKIIHDIRQPLSSLCLYSDLLEKQLQQPQQLELMHNLKKSSAQLAGRLSALSDITRLDAGKVQPQLSRTAVTNAFQPLIKKYQYQAEQKGLILKIRFNNLIMLTDTKLVTDILDHLLSNAFIHGSQSAGSSILLSARHSQNSVNLQVWNQGTRIEDSSVTSLFNEVFHAHNPLHDKRKGLGLGLAVAQRKAHLLKTQITVKTSDQGSCFSLRIKKGQQVSEELPNNSIKRENNEHILLIDDDSSILGALAMLLEGWGYQVCCAETSEQALTALTKNSYALIISDFRLPGGKNGIDLIHRAQQLSDIPAVLLTGEVDPEKLKGGKTADYRVLHKPIKPAALRILLRRLLR